MGYDYFSSAAGYRIQKTLQQKLHFSGVGLHTGVHSTLQLNPAPPNHGIVFERIDGKRPARFLAHFDAVVSTNMATSLGIPGRENSSVATVEHLLSALYALGVTNVTIEVGGPEIPILDGSSLPFIKAILGVGLTLQPFSNPILRILKPIKIYRGGTICELLPRNRLRLTTSVDFPHPTIGLQTYALDLSPRAFQDEVASARTFGFTSDLEKLRKANLALGATLENVLAFSETGVMNPDGARFPDECVRHKLLDAIGDLALSGSWIEGELVSFRGGHSIHIELLRTLSEVPSHWEFIPSVPLSNFYIRPEPILNLDIPNLPFVTPSTLLDAQ